MPVFDIFFHRSVSYITHCISYEQQPQIVFKFFRLWLWSVHKDWFCFCNLNIRLEIGFWGFNWLLGCFCLSKCFFPVWTGCTMNKAVTLVIFELSFLNYESRSRLSYSLLLVFLSEFN